MSTMILALLLSLPAQAQFSEDKVEKPSIPAPTLQGCSEEQKKTIIEAGGVAQDLLGQRIHFLKEEIAVMDKGGEPTAMLVAALTKHFAIVKANNPSVYSKRLQSVYEGMLYQLSDLIRWPKFTCDDESKQCKSGTWAYTYASQGEASRLCAPFFDKDASLRMRAATIIHEMAHRAVPTHLTDFDDKGYYSSHKPTPLGMADSLNNADSWANFIVDKPKAPKKK